MVADVEREQDLQAERRAHEPRRGDRRRRPHVAKPEALLEAPAELAVEHPQHDRHLGPALAQSVAHGQAGLDVREVI